MSNICEHYLPRACRCHFFSLISYKTDWERVLYFFFSRVLCTMTCLPIICNGHTRSVDLYAVSYATISLTCWLMVHSPHPHTHTHNTLAGPQSITGRLQNASYPSTVHSLTFPGESSVCCAICRPSSRGCTERRRAQALRLPILRWHL